MKRYLNRPFEEVLSEIKEGFSHWSYEKLFGEEYISIWENDNEDTYIGRLIIKDDMIVKVSNDWFGKIQGTGEIKTIFEK